MRQTFLTDTDVRSALREAIETLRLTHPFVIEAWYAPSLLSFAVPRLLQL